LQTNFISVWPESSYAAPLTHVRIALQHIFAVNDPALIRQVLLDNAANYQKTPIARRLFKPAIGEGVIVAEGDTWKRHRQMLSPVFAQRRIATLVPAMVEETEAFLGGWRRSAGSEFDLTRALSDITLRIITRTMFGPESQIDAATIAADSASYQKAMRPSVLDFLGVPNWVPRPGMRAANQIGERLTQTIRSLIARRRTLAEPRDDLLARLLEAVDQNTASAKEVRDEIATIILAGHETTAATLSWIFYLLDRHPEAEARILDELRQVLAGRLPGTEDLEHLRFTRMVAEEALRLYPPAHTITRRALGPDTLAGVRVPKGSTLMISPWLLHRNPNFWPAPDSFDPSRFDAVPSAQRTRYSYLPFGAGPRVCIGASFALTETVLVLATILRTWRVRLAPGHPVEPVALITMRPRWGLKATAVPRDS
jgi:cytochrome P450